MPTLLDRNQKQWRVQLDAPTIEEIREKHSIDLANLEKDPLLKLRNDPMTLVAVLYLICQEEIEAAGIGPKEFGKAMPSADDMLSSVREAIIDFFPSGRHSHVQEVLTKYEAMNAKSDELAIAKMQKVLDDKKTMDRLSIYADSEIEKELDKFFSATSNPGE